jgi:hypothetical protein
VNCHEGISGSGGIAPFLISVLDGDERLASNPGHFTPREFLTSVKIDCKYLTTGLHRVTFQRTIIFKFGNNLELN